jgi:8-amino-7-oxononanoate synthase
VQTPNTSGFPLIEIPLADPDLLHPVARRQLHRGIYSTLAPNPGVPRDQVGFRLQVTAANTDEQIDAVLAALSELAAAGMLRARVTS